MAKLEYPNNVVSRLSFNANPIDSISISVSHWDKKANNKEGGYQLGVVVVQQSEKGIEVYIDNDKIPLKVLRNK